MVAVKNLENLTENPVKIDLVGLFVQDSANFSVYLKRREENLWLHAFNSEGDFSISVSKVNSFSFPSPKAKFYISDNKKIFFTEKELTKSEPYFNLKHLNEIVIWTEFFYFTFKDKVEIVLNEEILQEVDYKFFINNII